MSINLSTQVKLESVGTTNQGRVVVPLKSESSPELENTRQENTVSGNTVPVDLNVKAGEAANKETVNQVELSEAVSRLNKHIQMIHRELQFTIDDELDRVIIKVLDSETSEEIRQIPAEVVLQIARNIKRQESFQLLDTEA